jgi:hypothetical protein
MEVCIKTLVIFLNEEEAPREEGETRSFSLMLTKEKQSEIKFHLRKGSFLPNKCMSNQIV